VLVREVRAYIVNKLFKLVHRFLCSCLYRQQIVQARTPLPFHILWQLCLRSSPLLLPQACLFSLRCSS
jgi:hypothetical protein